MFRNIATGGGGTNISKYLKGGQIFRGYKYFVIVTPVHILIL